MFNRASGEAGCDLHGVCRGEESTCQGSWRLHISTKARESDAEIALVVVLAEGFIDGWGYLGAGLQNLNAGLLVDHCG